MSYIKLYRIAGEIADDLEATLEQFTRLGPASAREREAAE